MPTRHPAVYMLASRRNGTLYIGVTGDLVKRVWEHRNDFVGGFTRRHGVHPDFSRGTNCMRTWPPRSRGRSR